MTIYNNLFFIPTIKLEDVGVAAKLQTQKVHQTNTSQISQSLEENNPYLEAINQILQSNEDHETKHLNLLEIVEQIKNNIDEENPQPTTGKSLVEDDRGIVTIRNLSNGKLTGKIIQSFTNGYIVEGEALEPSPEDIKNEKYQINFSKPVKFSTSPQDTFIGLVEASLEKIKDGGIELQPKEGKYWQDYSDYQFVAKIPSDDIDGLVNGSKRFNNGLKERGYFDQNHLLQSNGVSAIKAFNCEINDQKLSKTDAWKIKGEFKDSEPIHNEYYTLSFPKFQLLAPFWSDKKRFGFYARPTEVNSEQSFIFKGNLDFIVPEGDREKSFNEYFPNLKAKPNKGELKYKDPNSQKTITLTWESGDPYPSYVVKDGNKKLAIGKYNKDSPIAKQLQDIDLKNINQRIIKAWTSRIESASRQQESKEEFENLIKLAETNQNKDTFIKISQTLESEAIKLRNSLKKRIKGALPTQETIFQNPGLNYIEAKIWKDEVSGNTVIECYNKHLNKKNPVCELRFEIDQKEHIRSIWKGLPHSRNPKPGILFHAVHDETNTIEEKTITVSRNLNKESASNSIFLSNQGQYTSNTTLSKKTKEPAIKSNRFYNPEFDFNGFTILKVDGMGSFAMDFKNGEQTAQYAYKTSRSKPTGKKLSSNFETATMEEAALFRQILKESEQKVQGDPLKIFHFQDGSEDIAKYFGETNGYRIFIYKDANQNMDFLYFDPLKDGDIFFESYISTHRVINLYNESTTQDTLREIMSRFGESQEVNITVPYG